MIFGPVSHSFCSYVCIADVTNLRMMNPFPIKKKKKKDGVCRQGCHKLVHINKNKEGGFRSVLPMGTLGRGVCINKMPFRI